MEKFSRWIVNHKVVIICVFILLIALSIVGFLAVDKQGDVLAYLKEDTDTMIGKKVLEDEYNIVGDASIAISYLSRADVQEFVKRISSTGSDRIPEVAPILSKLVWIGTFDNVSSIPSITQEELQYTQEQAQKKFVKTNTDSHGNEVDTYVVSVYFETAGSDDRTIDALNAIDAMITDKVDDMIANGELPDYITSAEQVYYVGGMAQNARVLLQSSIGDMPKFFAVAVAAVLVILLLTTKSYIEPLIFLATLGISLLLNMGSNVIAGIPGSLGTISSITSSCSMILQLAIAMDYSIFLMHSYYEELEHSLTPKEAIVAALPKTLKSIAASALTTVGGFVALFFMQYRMGYDLGFVLAKGVILSLLSVIFLQPVLILIFSKLVKKTTHKWTIDVKLRPVAKVVTRKWVAIGITVVCLAVVIPCAYFQTQAPLNYITMTKENPAPSNPEIIATELNNQLIVMVPYHPGEEEKHYAFIDDLNRIGTDTVDGQPVNKDGTPASEAYSAVEEVFSLYTIVDKSVLERVENMPELFKNLVYEQLHASFISNIMTPSESGNMNVINTDESVKKYVLYTVNLANKPEDIASYNSLNAIRKLATDTFGEANITGLAQGAYELSKVTPNDFAIVNIVSAAIIFLILLLTFRKPLLSLLLLLVIETGIFFNLTLVYLIGTEINFMAYLIVSAIELGATVDYAILVTSKYYEELDKGYASETAIKNAIFRGASSVLTSGSILIAVCLCVRLVTSNIIVAQITELIARGALMSLILVFTFLPALLFLRDKIRRKILIARGKGDPDEGKKTEALCDTPGFWTLRKQRKAAALAGIPAGVVDPEAQSDSAAGAQSGDAEETDVNGASTAENAEALPQSDEAADEVTTDKISPEISEDTDKK